MKDLTELYCGSSGWGTDGSQLRALKKLTNLGMPSMPTSEIQKLADEGIFDHVRTVYATWPLRLKHFPQLERADVRAGRGEDWPMDRLETDRKIWSMYLRNPTEDELISFSGLKFAQELENLTVNDLESNNIEPLKQLGNLRFLRLDEPEKSVSELDFRGFASLERLYIQDAPGLRGATNVPSISTLEHLLVHDCPLLTEFGGEPESMPNLQVVRMWDLPQLGTLMPVRNARKLSYLYLSDLTNLQSSGGLDQFESRSIYISECGRIADRRPTW